MSLKTLAQAAIITGFGPELLKKFVSYAPKPGHSRKLQAVERQPSFLFEESELISFKGYLREPWPKPASGGRPTIPSYIKDDVKAECHHRCAICGDMNNGEVAHIDAVATSLNNSPDNLLLLCPNHHTEYDLGFKASNLDVGVIRPTKQVKRNSRRRILLWEANATNAYLALIEELSSIYEMLRGANEADYIKMLGTHLEESMQRLPKLREAAKEASSRDERLQKVDALTSVALRQVPSHGPVLKRSKAIEISEELSVAVSNVDLSDYQPVSCPVCDGSGTRLGRDCDLCDGQGEVEVGLLDNVDLSLYELRECPVCDGSGTRLGRDCDLCDGQGEVDEGLLDNVDLSLYELRECPVCDGSGTHLSRSCNFCGGAGMVPAHSLE